MKYLNLFLLLFTISQTQGNQFLQQSAIQTHRNLEGQTLKRSLKSTRVRGLTRERKFLGVGSNDYDSDHTVGKARAEGRTRKLQKRGERKGGKISSKKKGFTFLSEDIVKGSESADVPPSSAPTLKPTRPTSKPITISTPKPTSPATNRPTPFPTNPRPTNRPTPFPTNPRQTNRPTPSPTNPPRTDRPTPSPTNPPRTNRPTPYPTNAKQTIRPTPSPTNPRPTNRPTPFPTNPRQTNRPTPFPTNPIPKPDPTPRPTIRPPTPNPTDSNPQQAPITPVPVPETPKPTLPAPTTPAPFPVPRPTPATTICQTDPKGDYGSRDGDVTEVDYLYQMELFPGVTVKEAMAQIEEQVVNYLLPVLFPESCAQIRRLVDESIEEVSFYTGISSSPPNVLAVGFECVGLFLEPCFVVRGFVTTWSKGLSVEEVTFEVSTAIHNIIDSGAIEKNVIDVDKVTSLRDPALTAEPIPPSYPQVDSGRASPARRNKVPSPAPSPRNVFNHGQKHSQVSPTVHEVTSQSIAPSVTPSTVSNQTVTQSLADHQPFKFILRLPWWLWSIIFLELLLLCAAKVAYNIYRQQEKLDHKQEGIYYGKQEELYQKQEGVYT